MSSVRGGGQPKKANREDLQGKWVRVKRLDPEKNRYRVLGQGEYDQDQLQYWYILRNPLIYIEDALYTIKRLRRDFDVDNNQANPHLPEIGPLPGPNTVLPPMRMEFTRNPEGKSHTQKVINVPTFYIAILMHARAYVDETRKRCGEDAIIDPTVLELADSPGSGWASAPNKWGSAQMQYYNKFRGNLVALYELQKAVLTTNKVIPWVELPALQSKVDAIYKLGKYESIEAMLPAVKHLFA